MTNRNRACSRVISAKSPRRYTVSFPVALLGQPVQIIAPAWIAGRHACLPQQFFDRIAMGLLLALQHFLLAASVILLGAIHSGAFPDW